jgi:hypothetical protein
MQVPRRHEVVEECNGNGVCHQGFHLARVLTGSVDDVPVAFHDQPNQSRRGSFLIGNTLEVLIGHTACGAGPAQEVETTASCDDLQIVLVSAPVPSPVRAFRTESRRS